MQTLTLNDGTVWNGSVILSGGTLFFYVNGITLKTLFNKLINQSTAKKITAAEGEVTTVYRGYTKLIAVRDEGNGLFTAVAEKE